MRAFATVLAVAYFFCLSSIADAAVLPGGTVADDNISVGYDAKTGRVFVDAGGNDLEYVALHSERGLFSGDPTFREMCRAIFCNDTDFFMEIDADSGLTIPFGNVSQGNVAALRLPEDLLLRDLNIEGRLFPRGEFGREVDLIYVPFIPLAGDTNGDGVINIEDLNNVRNHFGATGPDNGRLEGDVFPFNGVVDMDDLNAVRNRFGAVAGPLAVPEPAGIAIAIWLALLALVAPRRTRNAAGRL